MENRRRVVENNPYFPPSRISSLLGQEWREHKAANDEVYNKFKSMYAQQVFFKRHRHAFEAKYPHFTHDEITKLLTKIYENSNLN